MAHPHVAMTSRCLKAMCAGAVQFGGGLEPLVPPTLHAVISMPIEVVIGIPADEGVGGVVVH